MCKFVSCRILPIDWNNFIELPKLKTLTLIDEHGDLASDDGLKMASWECPPLPEGCGSDSGGSYSC